VFSCCPPPIRLTNLTLDEINSSSAVDEGDNHQFIRLNTIKHMNDHDSNTRASTTSINVDIKQTNNTTHSNTTFATNNNNNNNTNTFAKHVDWNDLATV
jgi:hypothetical protein